MGPTGPPGVVPQAGRNEPPGAAGGAADAAGDAGDAAGDAGGAAGDAGPKIVKTRPEDTTSLETHDGRSENGSKK